MQLVHVSCGRFADVGKGNEKIRRDRGGQHHRRKASRTGGADSKKVRPSRRSTRRRHGISHPYTTTDDTSGFRESVAHEPNVSHTLHFVQRGYRVARQETRTHNEKYWWVLSQDVPLSVLDIEEPTTSGHPAVNTNMENTSSRPELKITIQAATYSLDLREEVAVVLTSRDSTEIEKKSTARWSPD